MKERVWEVWHGYLYLHLYVIFKIAFFVSQFIRGSPRLPRAYSDSQIYVPSLEAAVLWARRIICD